MSNSKPIVYLATNSITGERYVGFTTQPLSRRRSHHVKGAISGRNPGPFAAAIREHGADAFLWEVLAVFDDPKSALAAEQATIKAMRPEYNGTSGGGAYKPLMHSEETKKKLRELGQKNKDKFAKYATLGPAASARRVVRLDDGVVYASTGEAARLNGVSRSMVVEVCNRNPRRLTAGGKVYRYEDDNHDGVAEAEAIHCGPTRRGTNPYRGVYPHISEGKNTGKWRARVTWGARKVKWLGIFDTAEDARDAFLIAMEDLKNRGLR